MDSIPGHISWIVSQHDLVSATFIVAKYFIEPEISEFGVMFSLVGNKLPEDSELLLTNQLKQLIEVEVLSITDHAIRLISKNKDVNTMLEVLAKHLKLAIEA